MPSLLRAVRRARWLHSGDVTSLQADALLDLRTQRNELSVWWIEDDESNLDDVVAAIAVARDRIGEVDFVLLDAAALDALPIQVVATPGATPLVPARVMHRDLIHLSVGNIVDVAALILHAGPPRRLGRSTVRQAIARALPRVTLNSMLLVPRCAPISRGTSLLNRPFIASAHRELPMMQPAAREGEP